MRQQWLSLSGIDDSEAAIISAQARLLGILAASLQEEKAPRPKATENTPAEGVESEGNDLDGRGWRPKDRLPTGDYFLSKLRPVPGLNFLLFTSSLLACKVEEACSYFRLARSVSCACRSVPSRSSPSGACAGCFVRCASSHLMSRCIVLSLRAGGLIKSLCIPCMFFQPLLIFDVESALSVLAAASAAVTASSLLARRCAWTQALSVSCRVLPTTGRQGGRPRRPCRALSTGVARLPRGLIALLAVL